jgi:hypothetical protein
LDANGKSAAYAIFYSPNGPDEPKGWWCLEFGTAFFNNYAKDYKTEVIGIGKSAEQADVEAKGGPTVAQAQEAVEHYLATFSPDSVQDLTIKTPYYDLGAWVIRFSCKPKNLGIQTYAIMWRDGAIKAWSDRYTQWDQLPPADHIELPPLPSKNR